MFGNIVAGLGIVFRRDNILWALVGVTAGIGVGIIPGWEDCMTMCLLIPFTRYLQPIPAIAMLMGLSKGANFGGSVPAILLNLPGTPQAAVTALDGYPLAEQGKSGKALKMALYASCSADLMSDFVLFFLAAPVAILALKIGPPEYTMLILFSLVAVGAVGSENVFRGLIAIGFGLLLAVIGLDPISGTPRFCFGSLELTSGIGLGPMVIGLLIFSEIFRQIEIGISTKNLQNSRKDNANQLQKVVEPSNHCVSSAEFKHCLKPILSGTGIGSMIGALPGIGTTVASYLSYTFTKRQSKHPERFGKGALEGVAAAEAGNNAVVGPNLIPLITLGIPGNVAAALVLGGFMMQGLTPGPLFMQQHAPMLYALFTVLIISNIFTFFVGHGFLRIARYIRLAPMWILYPGAIIIGVIGSYVYRSSSFDIMIAFALGIIAYLLLKLDIPLPPIVVSFILAEMIEKKLRQSLLISGGDISVFWTHPISLVFFLLSISVIVFSVIYKMKTTTI